MANGAVMSDEFHFNGEDDAKAEIRAAVRYLLEGTSGSDRGDIVQEIIAIVNEVARGQRPGHDPLDDAPAVSAKARVGRGGHVETFHPKRKPRTRYGEARASSIPIEKRCSAAGLGTDVWSYSAPLHQGSLHRGIGW